MKPEFYKIKHADLLQYSQSEAYQKLNEKPVSQERIVSYVKNPNALPDDYVLYVLCAENQLIAYRSLLPDNYGDNPKTHFAWLSGNWVQTAFRGQGYSSRLLREANTDWHEKLMYTNYAPESHALYQKSGLFHKISSRTGSRFYLFPKTRILLKHRVSKPFVWVLPIVDVLISCYANLKILMSSKPASNGCIIESMQQPDDEFYKAFNQRETAGFQRSDSELRWILNYPWVSNDGNNQNYFFSHYAKSMYYRFLWIKSEAGENIGWAILHFRDGILKTPYYHADNAVLSCLARYIIDFSKAKKIQQFRCFDANLTAAINQEKHLFIYQKPARQNVFAAWDTNPENPCLSDGDGDYVFT
ncbi:MAG: GNAT family N-acetyltransferase [Bacteroidales bacterium]|nr:GNAT family N-acetyltransferase [Bacteroidales bacterium]